MEVREVYKALIRTEQRLAELVEIVRVQGEEIDFLKDEVRIAKSRATTAKRRSSWPWA